MFDALAVSNDESAVRARDCCQEGYLCLLSDDQLITGISIESHEVLEAKPPGYVEMDVSVTITAVTPMSGTYVSLFG